MARLQLLYRVVARMENRRLVEAMHEVKMAELMKKAKARQLEESRSCFGRALVDHRKIDFAERKRLNATENRIEARLIKRRDRLE